MWVTCMWITHVYDVHMNYTVGWRACELHMSMTCMWITHVGDVPVTDTHSNSVLARIASLNFAIGKSIIYCMFLWCRRSCGQVLTVRIYECQGRLPILVPVNSCVTLIGIDRGKAMKICMRCFGRINAEYSIGTEIKILKFYTIGTSSN